MMNSKPVVRMIVVIFGFGLIAAIGSPSACAQVKAAAPGKLSEAKKLLDLTKVPLIAGAKVPAKRTFSKLTYEAPGRSVDDAFAFHRKQLLDAGWKQDQGGVSTMGTFRQGGYVVTLSTNQIQVGIITVECKNLGNLNMATLPKPAGSNQIVSNPDLARYLTSSSVETATKAVQKSLTTKGWQAYGEEKDVLYFKQNAIRLAVRIYPQGEVKGKTLIDFRPEFLSYDLPALSDATELKYEDSTGQLTFNTKSNATAVAEYYTKELTKQGWKTESQTLTKSASGETMTFANPDDAPLTLLVATNGDTIHVELKPEPPKVGGTP